MRHQGGVVCRACGAMPLLVLGPGMGMVVVGMVVAVRGVAVVVVLVVVAPVEVVVVAGGFTGGFAGGFAMCSSFHCEKSSGTLPIPSLGHT